MIQRIHFIFSWNPNIISILISIDWYLTSFSSGLISCCSSVWESLADLMIVMAITMMIPARISPMLMSAKIDWPLSFFNRKPPMSLSVCEPPCPAYLDILPDVVDHHQESQTGRAVADRGEVEIEHAGPLGVPSLTGCQRRRRLLSPHQREGVGREWVGRGGGLHSSLFRLNNVCHVLSLRKQINH